MTIRIAQESDIRGILGFAGMAEDGHVTLAYVRCDCTVCSKHFSALKCFYSSTEAPLLSL
ncbi:MAG: hypothetical protein RID53_35565 [Coleofasciculus sp. B1-GNL1-01]|uniref:hypothetical protein n=1 Tax=Coleofasciculus sp. B1-GNL1-01 TaxID=3068484 RepID=UPI0032FF7C63